MAFVNKANMGMKVCKLRTLLDENRFPALVKENDVNYAGASLKSPEAIVDMLNSVFQHKDETEEIVYLLAFGSKELIGVFELSHGTVASSFMNEREILIKLFACGAVWCTVAHNHPSGDPSPSSIDRDSTLRLAEACRLVGIPLKDSLVIGSGGGYYSFHEEGII